LTIKGEEGSIFYKVKGCIFFRLFLSNEPGTGKIYPFQLRLPEE
jgi:hypothetical protein